MGPMKVPNDKTIVAVCLKEGVGHGSGIKQKVQLMLLAQTSCDGPSSASGKSIERGPWNQSNIRRDNASEVRCLYRAEVF